MSIVARVFIVLNLIVSIIFLIFSMEIWTAKTKWQKMYEREREKNVEMKADWQNREIELETAVAQRAAVIQRRNQKISALLADVDKVTDENLALREEVGVAKAQVEVWQAMNEELVRENNRRNDEIAKLHRVLVKQQQAVAVAKQNEVRARNDRAEMEDELNTLRQAHAALARDKRSIEQELAMQNRRFETLLAKGYPVWQILQEDVEAVQPFIPDALVLAVKADVQLAMLSVGAANGVKPGYRFTIKRGDKFIGKVQVEKVYPDMCSAKILPDMKAPGEEVQVHDEAISKYFKTQ